LDRGKGGPRAGVLLAAGTGLRRGRRGLALTARGTAPKPEAIARRSRTARGGGKVTDGGGGCGEHEGGPKGWLGGRGEGQRRENHCGQMAAAE